jgi:hypothetical protein
MRAVNIAGYGVGGSSESLRTISLSTTIQRRYGPTKAKEVLGAYENTDKERYFIL